MDIKDMIEKVVENIKKDPKLLEELKANPEKTIEKITGADLPDGIVDKVMAAVKSEGVEKLIDSVEDKVGGEGAVGGILDSLKKML